MNYILPIHNILRWAVLLFGFWTLFNALTGVFTKRNYSGTDNKASLFFMIICDIQLLLGLVLYFNGAWFDKIKSGMAAVMKNSTDRFFAVEHAFIMIIVWLMVHVGRSMVKRSEADNIKHRRSLIYFGIALLLIFLMIPWPFRQIEIARPLLRGF